MKEKVFALLSLAAPIVLALSLLAAPARASTFTLASSGGTFDTGNLVINPFTVDVGPGDLNIFTSGPAPFGGTLQYEDVGILSDSSGIPDSGIVSFAGTANAFGFIDIDVTHNASGTTETVAAGVVSFAGSGMVAFFNITFNSGPFAPVQGLFDVLDLDIVLAGTAPFSAPGDHGLELRNLTVHVPEPATIGLFGLALAGLGFARRRQR